MTTRIKENKMFGTRNREETGTAAAIMQDGAATYSADSTNAMREMEGLFENSRKMREAIAASSRRTAFELASIEELMLRFEVYKVLLGNSDLQAAQLPDATQCRLGQWYYEDDGHANFTRDAAFLQMEQPHQAVHEQARLQYPFIAMAAWGSPGCPSCNGT
jgi:hypothetical protein